MNYFGRYRLVLLVQYAFVLFLITREIVSFLIINLLNPSLSINIFAVPIMVVGAIHGISLVILIASLILASLRVRISERLLFVGVVANLLSPYIVGCLFYLHARFFTKTSSEPSEFLHSETLQIQKFLVTIIIIVIYGLLVKYKLSAKKENEG